MLNRSSHPRRSIVPIFHFLVVFLAGISGELCADVDPEARARAVEALDAGRTGEAIAILEQSLAQDPGAVELLELLGSARLRAGEPAAARVVWERLLRAFPERHRVRLWLAQLLEREGERDAARAHYRLLLDRESAAGAELTLLARLGLGRLALAAGRPAETRRFLDPLFESAPPPEAVLLMLRALEEEGLVDRALEVGRRFLGKVPEGNVRLSSLLRRSGVEAYRRGDRERALKDLTEASSLAPAIPVKRDLVRVLASAGQLAEAIEVLEGLLATEGPVEAVVTPLGNLLLAAGKPEEALALSRRALEADREARFARVLELKALAASGREAEFLERLRTGLIWLGAPRAGNPEWAPHLLAALDLLEAPQQALDLWAGLAPELPAETRPVLRRLYRKAGGLCLAAGDLSRAKGFFGKALETDPQDSGARRDLGFAEAKAGNPEGALRAWEPLLSADAADGEVLRGAARAHRDLGRPEEALAFVRKALEKDPRSGRDRRLLWSLLEEVGRAEDLVRLMDPREIAEIESGDIATVASLIDRHRGDEAFRSLLRRWREKLPGDPVLRSAEARARREDARRARQTGAVAAALDHYRASLALDPVPGCYRDLGFALKIAGDHEGALEAFRKALDLEPKNTEGRAVLARALREFGRPVEARRVLEAAEAEALASDPHLLLESARQEYAGGRIEEAAAIVKSLCGGEAPPAVAEGARLLLADAASDLGETDLALATLKDLCQANPQNADLLSRFLRTAGFWQRRAWAAGVLEELARAHPDSPARRLLGQEALKRGDLDRAGELLRRQARSTPKDALLWNLLADVEFTKGDYQEAWKASLEALKADPRDRKANLTAARAELQLGSYRNAKTRIEQILSLNPHQYDARMLRAEVFQRMGDLEAALAEWETLRKMFPDELDLSLLRARLLYQAGILSEAREEIGAILRLAEEGALPVLCYHGVSAHFEGEALPATLFRDQMRSLRDAGYTAVSLRQVEAWLAGEEDLPPHPVLLTFDDARADNLLVADPILEEFGHRAVEFVITGFVTDARGFYMSWSDLRKLAATGRWELDCHGHRAHQDLPVSGTGERGRFLASRAWIPEKRRPETRKEMEQRLIGDIERSKEELRARLGVENSIAYAFPFGSIGQREITNEPGAYPLVRSLFHTRFRIGFHQSGGTFNLRSRSKGMALLTRFQVPDDWDGPRLLRHLEENEPGARARLELAKILSWSGRYAESLEELDRAAEAGLPEQKFLATRAQVLLWQGDAAASSAEYRRLLTLDPADPRALEGLEKAERELRPAASARLELWFDSDDRTVFRQIVRGEGNVLPWLRLHGEVGHARYSEDGLADIDAAVAEVGAEAVFAGPLEADAALGESWFFEAQDKFHYAGAVRWKGWDRVTLAGEAAGGPVETPEAVFEGIHQDSQTASAALRPTLDDRIRLSYRNAFYSDANRRDTVRGEYAHRFLTEPTLRLGVDATYDNTRKDVDEYYAPQDLILGRVFAELEARLLERLDLLARGAGGYGAERDDDRPVGEGALRLRWRFLDWMSVESGVRYYRNPNYWGTTADMNFVIRF